MDAYLVRPAVAGLAPQIGQIFGVDPIAFADEHPVGAAIIAVFAVIALALVLWVLRAVWRRGGHLFRTYVAPRPTEDILTIVSASIATGVSAQGMWTFAGDVLGFSGPLRLLLFAFIEVAVITSAVRARRNMRENYAAGIDGLAVWVLTSLSAVLSAMHAASVPEFVFRLSAPLVAAWLWERGMAIERVKLTGRRRINWRLTPERALVRLGLAESSDRTASDVDMHRRLTRLARAAARVHQLRTEGGKAGALARALARRARALDQAVEHTGLATDPVVRARLLNIATTLGGGDDLTGILSTAPAPWTYDDHPAVTGAARESEARELAAELRDWTASIRDAQSGDKEVNAAITSMAAYIAGGHVVPPSPEVQEWMTFQTAALPTPDVTPGGTEPAGPGDVESDESSDEANDADTSPELDNKAAEEWIRRQCRGVRGVGQRPSVRAINDKHGGSPNWARARLTAVTNRMKDQGYEFTEDGKVLSPRRTVKVDTFEAAPELTTNGAGR